MAIPTSVKEIDGCEIRCNPVPSRAGARMLARLLRYAGPVFQGLWQVDFSLAHIHRTLTFMQFVPVVSALMKEMTPEEYDEISCQLLGCCTVIVPDAEGKRNKYELSKVENVDKAFEGRLTLMVKVIAYVLEVHYAGFFRELGYGEMLDALQALRDAPPPEKLPAAKTPAESTPAPESPTSE